MPNGGLDDLPDSLIAKQLADLMVKDENISATGQEWLRIWLHVCTNRSIATEFWQDSL